MVLSLVKPELSTGPSFDEFWRTYPRRVARRHAIEMWDRLTDAEQTAAMRTLPSHLAYWQAHGQQAYYLPHPGTWLHGRRWEDELPKNGATVRIERKCPCGRPLDELGYTHTSAGDVCNPCFARR
jgi:hypothetical protein